MSGLWLLSHLLLWIALIAQTVVIVSLMRQVGSLLLRVGPVHVVDAGVGPDLGQPAPWLPETPSVGDRPRLLTFLSTACGTCDALVPALNEIDSAYRRQAEVVVLTREQGPDVERWKRRHGLKVPVIPAAKAFSEYSVTNTPYVFIVDSDGYVAARGGVNHIEHLEALLRQCGAAKAADLDSSDLALQHVGGEDLE